MRRGKSYFLHNIMLRLIIIMLTILSTTACVQFDHKVNEDPIGDRTVTPIKEIPKFDGPKCNLDQLGHAAIFSVPVFYQGKWDSLNVAARYFASDRSAWIIAANNDSIAFGSDALKCWPDSIWVSKKTITIKYAEGNGASSGTFQIFRKRRQHVSFK